MMSAGMTVTVLIAAYNAAPFLHRAVHSALNQTVSVLEVLVVDDASEDDTACTARLLSMADHRVRLIALPQNGGPSKARNAGLDQARGDWVAVLDADDAFLPDRLERMLKVAQATRADIVLDNFSWYDPATRTVGGPGIPASRDVEHVDVYRFAAQARPFTDQADWGLLKPLFRRHFLTEHGLRYPEFSRHGEDYLFALSILLAGGRCTLIRTPGYLYTHRSSGMSRTLVDYDSMATHTTRLAHQPQISADRKLRRLLCARSRAIHRLAVEHRIRLIRDQRRITPILRLALTQPRGLAAAVLRIGWRKARSSFSLF